jgi:hypothetical protein
MMSEIGRQNLEISPSQTLFCSGRLRWVCLMLDRLMLPITRKRIHKRNNLRHLPEVRRGQFDEAIAYLDAEIAECMRCDDES